MVNWVNYFKSLMKYLQYCKNKKVEKMRGKNEMENPQHAPLALRRLHTPQQQTNMLDDYADGHWVVGHHVNIEELIYYLNSKQLGNNYGPWADYVTPYKELQGMHEISGPYDDIASDFSGKLVISQDSRVIEHFFYNKRKKRSYLVQKRGRERQIYQTEISFSTVHIK